MSSGNEDPHDARAVVDSLYRSDSRRVLATLIRLLGDFDLAEEALHDAFTSAVERWPIDGIPSNPRGWLISAGRFQAIDRLRRSSRHDDAVQALELTNAGNHAEQPPDDGVEDDRLRLIFTCCHPALSLDAQIALTLRTICGLTTEEIAHAFLTPAPTLAQRIVRAKAKIRDARIPYLVPSEAERPDRLAAVLHVIYLVFSEGYSPSSGATVVRADLADEAIRLARLLAQLLPEAEALGLLALLLLQDSRREARVSPDGDLLLLEEQDRTRWNRDQIREGSELVERALRTRQFGAYTLQAAIAAVHAGAVTADATDWRQIVGLYDLLLGVEPSPVVELNRAVAVAMSEGAGAGLAIVDALMDRGALAEYHLLYSARADLCRRLGRLDDASHAYTQALLLTTQAPERRFLERRLAEVRAAGPTRR